MKTKMKFTKRFFSVLFIASLMMACSKDDGNDGAVGPQGAQGEQGPAGAQGESGEDGETGTANVIYSDWIVSGFEDDIMSTSSTFEIDAPLLTDEIINNGVILVYGRTPSIVYPLPATFPNTQEAYYIRIPVSGGTLQVRVRTLDGSDVGGTIFDEYRYILIPGGTSAGKSAASKDYSKMTYEEIVEHFNIPE